MPRSQYGGRDIPDYSPLEFTVMTLDQQLQSLISDAPRDGSTPEMVASIAPVLKTMAQRLRHLEYFVVQTLDQSWVMVTLEDRTQSMGMKNVIYAFSTLKDVSSGLIDLSDPNLIAMPVPVTHLLFQMLAMDNSYSTIFFETPGDVSVGTEIARLDLEKRVQEFWQNLADADAQSNIPNDIA
jgi:hypothetical protein